MEVNESILEINKYRLDEELENQPKLYFQFSSALADAKRKLEELKAEESVVVAELKTEIRMNPGEFDVVKVTEDSVYSALVQQQTYGTIQRKVIEAKHAVDILDAMVWALSHRKSSLENLVYLHGQNYFSRPNVDPDNEIVKRSVRNRSSREKD